MGLTREQLFRTLNVINDGPDLEAITKKAMVDYEQERWKNGEYHVQTSFYASQFPGDEKSCQRKLLYGLMNIPNTDPMPPKLRGQTKMGNAAEEYIVSRLVAAKKTLHIMLDEDLQNKFEDPDTWLSGATDLILDLREEGYNAILPVDIKSKDHEVIQHMRIGVRNYDEKHYYQVQAYIYMCRKFHNRFWKSEGLKPANAGILYYVSRQDPTFVKQFYFPYDPIAVDRAIATMKETKEAFLNDELPERPKEWKWTEEPCKWCPFKREACKKDWKAGVKKISESNGIEFAKHVNSSYDYDEIKLKVEERWNSKNPKQ